MDKSKTPPPRSMTDARREREAEALRANLRKRKEQQRARDAAARDEKSAAPGDPSDEAK